MGTLTNSTQRQSSRPVSSPPARTPAAAPLAAVADQTPIARRRWFGSAKVEVSRDSDVGASTAPPSPWAARAAISQLPPWARPPSRLAAVNSTRPTRKTRRRPNRSAARPPSMRNPAKASV